MVANTAHVLANKVAKFADFIIFGRYSQVFGLEVGVHRDVTLEALFADQALEADLRFKFFLACRSSRGCRSRDTLIAKLHKQVGVHFFVGAGLGGGWVGDLWTSGRVVAEINGAIGGDTETMT